MSKLMRMVELQWHKYWKHRDYKKRQREMAHSFEEQEREWEMWDPEMGNPVG